MHKQDEPKQLILFDVQTTQGIIPPEQFISDFSNLHIAQVVYRRKLTSKFVGDVRERKYGVIEGVVCKGGSSCDALWMVKIKTYTYIKNLQQAFRDDREKYWE
jgi:hypothetical protein